MNAVFENAFGAKSAASTEHWDEIFCWPNARMTPHPNIRLYGFWCIFDILPANILPAEYLDILLDGISYAM